MSDEVRRSLWLPDEPATFELGRRLGSGLGPGQGVGLCGELGAGKTSLTRGIAVGLGVDDPDAVASPTYLLVIEHEGPLPLVHVDAYLPAKTRAFLLDGGVDYLAELGGVVVVEWADRIADLMPRDTLWVHLRPGPAGRGGRNAELVGPQAFAALLAQIGPGC